MKLSEIYQIADALAPKRLSDEYCEKYDGYDNSGVLVDTGKDVDRILFSLDFSLSAIERAKEERATLILTHHPAIYGKIGSIQKNAFEPLSEKLLTVIEQGISVISMHLNLDMAVGGIDECLRAAVVESAKNATGAASWRENGDEPTMWQVLGGGYGRVYNLPEVKLGGLAEELKKQLQTQRVFVYGDVDRKITRVASFCGGGGDVEEVAFAVEQGAEAIISSDFKHHALLLAREKGLAVIQTTHYASENYGFKKYYEKIRLQTGLSCVYHEEVDLL